MFCSDACRTRHARHSEKPDRKLTDLTAFVLELTANQPLSTAFSNKRSFQVITTVNFGSNEIPGEWDLGLLSDYLEDRIAKVIAIVLKRENPEWQIQVVLQSKYRGPGG